ncbi:hypothetical protein A2V68_01600 [candidate division Kazan bacterium RBG_13_50_9]|uniref:Cell division protein FtsQ/DivIB C-terminal domain-containing protein n=1 Tax=candidate division Kazan bacterium RBG_13_50_9 TaxID=1798535 RepID=A0A1F4NRI9_UNCK3|nr:MAG: hypothetical protein A2V68_01600 [candidate division Kazan bacterium RBG_13_50_9]
MRRGFSSEFFLKKRKRAAADPRVRPKVVFYTTRPEIVKPLSKRAKRLIWVPRVKPKPFAAVASPMTKVALGVFLLLLAYWLLGSRAFVLREFTVEGNHLVPADEIQATVFPNGFRQVNAFLFREGKATQQILSIPQIREASFKKLVFAKRLVAVVEEHETTIVWQTNNERFMVNRAGVVYNVAGSDTPLVVVEDLKNVPVNLNQKIVTTDFIEFVTSLVANLPRKTNVAARRVMVPETTFEIEVVTSEGWTIILDTTRSVETQLNNLVKVLRTIGGNPRAYVDLRIEDRVYYK